MNLKRIDHLALTSADSEKARNWYCDLLGMKWVYQGQWKNNPYFLKKGNTYLAIFQAEEGSDRSPREGIRLDHFAFLAEEMKDFKEAQETLKEKGIAYEFQDHEIVHSIYFKDPDGHIVEITTYDVEVKNEKNIQLVGRGNGLLAVAPRGS